MGRENIFNNLNKLDQSYLLDPEVISKIDNTKVTDESVKEVDINKLVPFKDHPFTVNVEDAKFLELKDSISEYGILSPIVVRQRENAYEIIAGHCRVEAARLLNMNKVPVNIVELDDLQATILMVHSNVYAREKIAVSERAKAYRMCVEAERKTGKKVRDIIENAGAGQDSKTNVYRYIRLSYLCDELLGYVDKGINIKIGVELSYLDNVSQTALCEFIQEVKIFPDMEQAKQLRSAAQNEPLSPELIVTMLVGAPKPKTVNKVSFKTNEIKDYFDNDTSAEEMTDIIKRLLKKYKAGEIVL